MSKIQPIAANFLRGQTDTPDDDALPFGLWAVVQNFRVDTGPAKRRSGMVRIARAGNSMASVDLDGSTQYVTVPLDARPIADMKTQLTIEGLVAPDSITGTRPILQYGATTPSFVIDTASSKMRVRIWDTAATLTTLTSTSDMPTTTFSFQIVRDGASLTLRMDNASEDTGTMDADLSLRVPAGDIRFGYDGTNFFDGKLDYIRGFSVARSGHTDDHLRFPDPMARTVVFDWSFEQSADRYVTDHSRYGNTGLATGTPPAAATLAYQTAPVSCIHHYQNSDGEGRVLVVAGDTAYEGTV